MSDLGDRVNGNTLYLLSQIIRKTGRYQISGLHHLEAVWDTGRPFVAVAWHGMTMMLVGFFTAHYDLSSFVLILPDDWRGKALAIFTNKLGAHPFPMNLEGDSSMATARTLAKLVRRVREGSYGYVTPDGPDGPAYLIKPGVAYIARKANAALLPLGAYARHCYRLNRWDRYTVPYPFARISIEIGAPIVMERDVEDLSPVIVTLTDTLHRVTAQAAANYYEQRP
jgi:lysophospholipid acyltransferase (LPLAT)-like uncharacterized protein